MHCGQRLGSRPAEPEASPPAPSDATHADAPPLLLPGDVLDTLEVFVLNFQELAVRSKALQVRAAWDGVRWGRVGGLISDLTQPTVASPFVYRNCPGNGAELVRGKVCGPSCRCLSGGPDDMQRVWLRYVGPEEGLA